MKLVGALPLAWGWARGVGFGDVVRGCGDVASDDTGATRSSESLRKPLPWTSPYLGL